MLTTRTFLWALTKLFYSPVGGGGGLTNIRDSLENAPQRTANRIFSIESSW